MANDDRRPTADNKQMPILNSELQTGSSENSVLDLAKVAGS